jgi:membrane-associated protease RseP (regulator of RpoE activity)
MTMKSLLFVIPCAVMLCGCQSNYYADKYRSESTPGSERYLLPHTGAADVVPVPMVDLAAETAVYERRGYVVIGYSKFSADTDDYGAALRAQAQTVQADMVLSSAYAKGYRTDMGPMDPGNPMLANNSANTGGYIETSGSRPPATGAPTASVGENMAAAGDSNAVGISEYRAVFMRRRAVLMGANLEGMSGAQAMQAHVSQGARVVSVVDGSPAMHAGILPGDIIEAVDGQAVNDVDGYRQLIDARAGAPVRITLVRKGEEMTVPVQLNPMPGGR